MGSVQKTDMMHRQDNLVSAVPKSNRAGIHGGLFDSAAFNRYERILDRFGDETDGVTSSLAKASCAARLKWYADSTQATTLCEATAGVAGPILFAYVIWVLHAARKQQLNRIYFLARDGQILLKIARLCAPVTGYEGELKYLFASRQSWRLPAADDANFPQWAFENTDFLSLRSFLERVGMRPEEVEVSLLRHGFDPRSWDDNLGRRQRKQLHLLANEPDFLDRVVSIAAGCKRQLLAYLGEQGVLSGENFGIVDLGWNGTLQHSLEQLLHDTGLPLPIGFYFGLSRRAKEQRLSRSFAYFFDERYGTGYLRRNYWVEPMMEVFCAADHGMTLRFEKRDGRMQPVLKMPRNDRALAWGLTTMQNSVIEFVKLAISNSSVAFEPEALRDPIDALFSKFYNTPTDDEAEAWGTYPYFDDQTESVSREWAEPFDLVASLRSIYRGKMTPSHAAGWAPAALMRSHRMVRATLPLGIEIGGWIRRSLS
jgi:hypothetical protein